MKSMKNEYSEYSDPQKKTLQQLLHGLEKAQKDDILAYSFGHLNHKNLCKISGQQEGSVSWQSAKKPTPIEKEKIDASIQKSRDIKVKKMTDALVDFSLMTSMVPVIRTTNSLVLDDLDCTNATTSQDTPCNPVTPHTEAQMLQDHFIKEELELSTLMLIKPQLQKCEKSHTRPDQSQFVESYLAGLTRKDQFSKLLEFEKKILMKQDLLEREAMSGYKAVAKHERKLTRELMKIDNVPGPDMRRLQVFSDVFEDICRDSTIFCEILREIKAEYDVYLTSLLESLPTDRHKIFQAQFRGMASRTVKTHHVEEARQKVVSLEQEARLAIQRNDELRNELERELSKSEPLPKQQVAGVQPNLKLLKTKQQPQSVMEQVQSLRTSIYTTTVLIQELESEMKHSMVPSTITDAMKSSLRDTQGEIARLQKSNEFLRRTIKALENNIERTLNNYKVSKVVRENLWHMIKDLLDPAESKNTPISE
ncbi:uncharacterized protein C6orf118-like [Heptranchias perlo]|uniref:uncharacterized protein C6orf118-like n=1 Tax=Heptranchias perlo TaxID=212740 RepID=UPI00355952E9